MRLRSNPGGATAFGRDDHIGSHRSVDVLNRDENDPFDPHARRDDSFGRHGDDGSDDDGTERRGGLPALFRPRNPAGAAANPGARENGYVRELRTILSNLAKGGSQQRTPQRIVVTGVNIGTDGSMVARDLAATCAASGFRVLLVDANLNKPTVHRQFGVSNSAGLSNLLATADFPNRLPQSTAFPNLAVMAAGPKPPNYSGLLARERVFHRLEPIAHHFDYIVADAGTLPPSLVGRLSAGADNVLVVVKEHVSSMRELESMVRTLGAEGGPQPAVLMVE
jgi:Mrp family chromosome partitioning ATPase